METVAGMEPAMPIGEVGAYAQRVESLGFDTLHVAEMVHDPFLVAGLALAATSELRVRTGVALAFVRSPMDTAISAWDLAHLSGGRFDLGLGTQVRANIEHRYGMPFHPPRARMREHIECIRMCFYAFESGEALSFEGEFHRIDRLPPDFRPAELGPHRRPEVWLGAVGLRMLELAGGLADGLITHPTNTHPEDLSARLVPALQAGAANEGRVAPPIIASPMIATGLDAGELQAGIERLRRRLAFLYSTPAYWPTLEALGLVGLGERLRELTREQRWDDLAPLLDDEIVRSLIPVATYDDLPALLAEWFGNEVSGIVLRPPPDPSADDPFRSVVETVRSW